MHLAFDFLRVRTLGRACPFLFAGVFRPLAVRNCLRTAKRAQRCWRNARGGGGCGHTGTNVRGTARPTHRNNIDQPMGARVGLQGNVNRRGIRAIRRDIVIAWADRRATVGEPGAPGTLARGAAPDPMNGRRCVQNAPQRAGVESQGTSPGLVDIRFRRGHDALWERTAVDVRRSFRRRGCDRSCVRAPRPQVRGRSGDGRWNAAPAEKWRRRCGMHPP